MRLAVFASGAGSNMNALATAMRTWTVPASMVLCICNRPEAGALEVAASHGAPTVLLDPKTFADPDEYTRTLLDILERHAVNFIALAGYLRKIPTAVVDAFDGRMLNIHPALLPAFGGKGMYGMHVHRAVLDYGVRWSGVTLHLVNNEYDTGPIILQEPVPVEPGDTPETLAARIRSVEHRLYPEALRLFAENRVRVEGRSVTLLPGDA